MTNLIKDVSLLTDVSENTLKKFLNVSDYVIGHCIYESLCRKEDVVSIDIGVGQLDIKIDENKLHYRFIPSKDLEKLIIQTVTTNSSPMLTKLDNKLQEKIDRAYKELL